MKQFYFIMVRALLTSPHSSAQSVPEQPQTLKSNEATPQWLRKVKHGLRLRGYRIKPKATSGYWQSRNRAQNLNIIYQPQKVVMKPLQDSAQQANWNLELATKGLYADGELVAATTKQANAQIKDSMAIFKHGAMKIQYLNYE